MRTHLEDIIKLQSVLTELSAAQARLSGVPEWMADLHREHSERQAEITTLEETLAAADSERRSAEGSVSDVQEKLKKYQQQLNQVTTQREYGALLQEIDTAKASIQAAEQAGLGALEKREQAEVALKTARDAFEALDQRFRDEMGRWEAEKPAISAQIEELAGSIASLRERIPRPVLATIDRVRERNNTSAVAMVLAVERVVRGPRVYHCAACNYSVRPQVVVEIRTAGALVQCEGCKRILYTPPVEAPALAETQA